MELAGGGRSGPDRERPLQVQDDPGRGPDRRRKAGLLCRGVEGALVGVAAAGGLVMGASCFPAPVPAVKEEPVENRKRPSS